LSDPYFKLVEITNSAFVSKLQVVENCPIIWLVGLSGAGKSTLAKAYVDYLTSEGLACVHLDGDELRKGLNSNLGFTENERHENLRRAAEVAVLFKNSGVIPVCSFISPTYEVRKTIAAICGESYREIYVKCSLAGCEQRDVKGHYLKARKGELAYFTGISSPFDEPINPFATIDSENDSFDKCLQQLIQKFEF